MMQKLLLFTFIFLTPFLSKVEAQSKLGRYHKNLLYEADIYYTQGDYYYASELYREIMTAEPDNPEVLGRLGICYYHLPPYKDESLRYLELAVREGDTEAKFYLAMSRISQYRFFDALELIGKYENEANRMKSVAEIANLKASAERAIEMVHSPRSVTITNLGEGINTPHHDYAPVWDQRENKLFFTSRRKLNAESEKDISEQFDENIFTVDLNSTVQVAEAVSEPLNTNRNDAAVACDPKGNSIIIYRTSKDGYSGDLYLSEKKLYAWTEPEKLDESINSKNQEASASFDSKDPDLLYFSSDREGGFGGKDIYSVRKLPNGKWGKPENLGSAINTQYDEDAPFIDANGALYFASKGHTTMGGYDIFVSTREGGNWAEPVNIGYPINTPGDDIFFVLSNDGSQAYFSSERIGGQGLQDLYQVTFDESNTIILKGSLSSEEEKVPEGATITLLNDEDGSIEGLFQTGGEQGDFVLALNTNKKYTMLVEADGFQPLEKSLFYGSELNGIQEIKESLILSREDK